MDYDQVPSCCGAAVLYDFPDLIPYMEQYEESGKALRDVQNLIENACTSLAEQDEDWFDEEGGDEEGFALQVWLNHHQINNMPSLVKALKDTGFKPVHTFRNYNTDNEVTLFIRSPQQMETYKYD